MRATTSKTNKKAVTLLLTLFCLLATGAQATVRWVTSDSGGEEGGTFRYIIANLAEGDTIRFSPEVAKSTINLPTVGAAKFPNESPATAANKRLTILGDGVTLTFDETSLFFSSGPIAMDSLIVENIHFINNGSKTSVTNDIIFAARSGRIRNCSFTSSADAKAPLWITPTKGTILFEGCAFISTPTQAPSVRRNNAVTNVSFVSCTFVKHENSDNKYSLINLSNSATYVDLTNCVVMDYGSALKTFTVAPDRLSSKGYNVIRQSTTSPAWTQTISVEGDTIMPSDATPPLTLDKGIYKAPIGSPAYRHLLPKESYSDVLKTVDFPLFDLAGNGIDYTCKTHSGAWQETWLAAGETDKPKECEGQPVTGISITPPADAVIYTELTYAYTAVITPGDAADKSVNWTSSDPTIAVIEPGGVNTGKLTPLAPGKVTITATAASNSAVSATYEVTITAYPHVTSIGIPAALSFANYRNNQKRIVYNVQPGTALNKKLKWTLDDPSGTLQLDTSWPGYVVLSFDNDKYVPTLTGTATLKATADDNGYEEQCTIDISPRNFTDGVILVVEGNYTTSPGIVNFLHSDGHWDDKIFGGGVTGQFGTIYGDNFYYVAKQNRDLLAVNAADMSSNQHNCLSALPDGDPRSFVGVNDTTGYLSTSNGVYIIDLKFDPNTVNFMPTGRIEGAEGEASEDNLAGSGMYNAQSGTMVRAGNHVFAIHQVQGLLIINPATHKIAKVIPGAHNGLVMAHDGNLWSYDGGNNLLRIDPWTLTETPVILNLPAGTHGPLATAWGAWRVESLHADPHADALYWSNGGNDGFATRFFYRYDIASGTITNVLDLAADGYSGWSCYGPTFGIHPATGELYTALYKGNQDMDYTVLKLDPKNKAAGIAEYPMSAVWWFPAAFVFPDNAAPEISAAFPAAVTLNAAHRSDTLYVRPLITDADNLDAAITKTVRAIGNPQLVEAFFRHDSLFIRPLKDVTAAEQTILTLEFNSNGKVLLKDVTVNVQPGAIAHPVTGVTLNRTTAEPATGETLQLTATVTPENADNKAVTWTSSQPLFASVDENGLVTAHLAPVTVTITVTTLEGGYTATCTVTTKASSTHPVAGVTLDRTTAEMAVNSTLQLTATVAPSDADNKAVSWASSNNLIATVSANGLVTAKADGTAVITVTTAEGGKTASCTVTVLSPVIENPFELNTHTVTLDIGETAQLNLTAPEHYNVSWRSLNEDVAMVGTTGRVRAIAAGTVKIIAEDRSKGKADTCTVTVRPVKIQYTVRLNHTLLVMNEGERTNITATVSPADNQTVRWQSSNPAVADVTSGGTVIALSAGNVNITATLTDGTSAACNVTVRDAAMYAQVDETGSDKATLSFPKLSGTAYYMIHLFEISGGNRIPVIAYKVNPDGTIANIVNLRASNNNIHLTMNGLKSGTVYEADIEVIREIGGTAETVSALHVSFTTARATGIGYIGETTFSVYPNPFAGYIVVDATESGTASICDLSGKVILTTHVNAGSNRINTSALSKGVYVLRTGSCAVKIVK